MFILSCRLCGVEFEAKTNRRVYCSSRCKDKGKPCKNTGTCAVCGGSMEAGKSSAPDGVVAHNACRSGNGKAYCADHGTVTMYDYGCRCDACKAAKSKKNRDYLEKYRAEHGINPVTAVRRRFKEQHGFWPVTGASSWISHPDRMGIYERDSWTCHLCGDPIDRLAHWNDNFAPSLDHLIPRSKGGDDSPENLKLAHRICNSIRRDLPLLD